MSEADRILARPPELDAFAGDRRLGDALSRRVNADPESVERGLAQLVLTIVEPLRLNLDLGPLGRLL